MLFVFMSMDSRRYAASQTAHATHPAHLRVKAEIGDMRIARHQVDYAASDCGSQR